MMTRHILGALGFALLLAACGGGGNGGNPPPVVSPSCSAEVRAGYPFTRDDPSAIGGEADAGGNDGGIGEGDGSIGAGGALGKFRNARVEVIVGNSISGRGFTDSRGLATITICEADIDLPHTIDFVGGEGSQYFDEAIRRYVPFRTGERVSVQVPNMRRKFVGITTFTNAARSVTSTLASDTAGPALKDMRSPKAVAKSIEQDNAVVASIIADQLPGSFRSAGNDGRFRITGLPVSLDDQTIDQAGSIPDNDRGRYSAANAGFSVQAGIFLPGEPRPAITAAKQLAKDLSDGKLDMVDAAGCTIATTPEPESATGASYQQPKDACSGDVGDRLAYTYESLWRAKTIATSDVASSSGDSSLQQRQAQIAEYTTNVQKIIRVNECVRPDGSACPAPFYPRSDIRQTVKLNSRGQLTIEREAATNFAPGIGWIGGVVREFTFVNATYVDIRVGSRGEVVAIHKDRRKATYFPELEPYPVTGREFSVADARNRMQNALGQLGHYDVSFDKAIVSATIPPAQRQAPVNQPIALFVTVFSDGSFAHVIGANNVQVRTLPYAISGIVFDKFVPPGYNAAYGLQPGSGNYPFDGPRRQYVLTRQGKVRVMLEGNTASPGVELDIPGRVIQLAAESRANLYALNSDGKVYWINPDQAGYALHTVFQVDIPTAERICWVARRDAVTCNSGRVFRWDEVLRQIEYRPSGSSDPNERNITFAPTGIERAVPVELGGTPIWRLNSVDEFYQSSPVNGSFRSEGIRYLPVNGEPFDPDVAGTNNRSLHGSKCNFDGYGPGLDGQRPYLHGWQIRRALQSVFARAGRTTHVVSNGHRLNLKPGVPPIDTSDGFNASLSSDTSRSVAIGGVGQSPADNNCQQMASTASSALIDGAPVRTPTAQEIAQRGFSPIEFSLTSAVNPFNSAGQLIARNDLPAFRLSGRFAESASGFFIDITGGTVTGEQRPFQPRFPVVVWQDDAKYMLDRGLMGWEFDYRNNSTGAPDVLDIYRSEPQGNDCYEDTARCMIVGMVPRAVFDNPNQFRLCFDQQFNTPFESRTARLLCTLHEFDGSFVSIVMLENWSYPPRSDQRPASQIDFGFLLSRPG